MTYSSIFAKVYRSKESYKTSWSWNEYVAVVLVLLVYWFSTNLQLNGTACAFLVVEPFGWRD